MRELGDGRAFVIDPVSGHAMTMILPVDRRVVGIGRNTVYAVVKYEYE